MLAGVEANWRQHLAHYIDEIGPMPRGRYLPDLDRSAEWVAGERLIDPGYLRTAIRRARPANPMNWNPKDTDPRICLSKMSRQYCASLTTVALAGLAAGVGIDLSPASVTAVIQRELPFALTFDPELEPLLCKERPPSWPADGPAVETVAQLRRYVWTNLYARNLRVLFRTATTMVRVPERLLWTNAAEWVAVVMDSAIEYLDPERASMIVAEGRAVLEAETLPGFDGEPNPLRGLVEWLPFDDQEPRHGIQTRHLCCLVCLQTDRHGRLCQNCPLLPLPDRAALVRERRGTGTINLDGPAERRCMEVGVARRRF